MVGLDLPQKTKCFEPKSRLHKVLSASTSYHVILTVRLHIDQSAGPSCTWARMAALRSAIRRQGHLLQKFTYLKSSIHFASIEMRACVKIEDLAGAWFKSISFKNNCSRNWGTQFWPMPKRNPMIWIVFGNILYSIRGWCMGGCEISSSTCQFLAYMS